jgi:hypothetical protein
MIFYGTNGSHVRTAPLPGVACPNCATPDSLNASVFSRYAHIYWIPLFPYSKPIVAQCSHCQQAWEEKAMPAEIKAPAKALKQDTRSPLLHWAGLGVIAVLICVGVLMGARNDREDKAFLEAPHVGDIYTVRAKDDDKTYSLLKVVAVKGPTVDVVPNEYTINQRNALDELNDPAKYSKESFTLSQFELKTMQNKGQLTDVDRLEK